METGKVVIVVQLILLTLFSSTISYAQNDYCNSDLLPIKNYAKNKYGFIDRDGTVRIDFTYDVISNKGFENGMATVWINDSSYIIDETGKTISEGSEITFSENRGVITLQGKYGYVSSVGKICVPAMYDTCRQFSGNLAAVRLNNKYGYIDTSGKVVIPFQYDSAFLFREGIGTVFLDGKGFHINKAGKKIYAGSYEDAYRFYNGTAFVREKGKWGLINTKGEQVLPFRYDDVSSGFKEPFAWVSLNGKWGLIDKKGKELTGFVFENGYDNFDEKRYAVEVAGKWKFIDRTFKYINDDAYDDIHYFDDGLASVKKGRKWGAIDTTGRQVIPCIYDEPLSFYRPVIKVKTNGNEVLINKFGDVVGRGGRTGVPGDGLIPVYDEISANNYRIGFVDSSGKLVIDHLYSDASGWFSEGLCPVAKQDGKFYYINKKNETMFNGREFLYAGPFSGGFAPVKLTEQVYTYIDKSGRETGEYFEEASFFQNGYAHVTKQGKKSIINLKREIVLAVPEPYDISLYPYCNGVIQCYFTVGANRPYVDADGRIINGGQDYYGYADSKGRLFFFIK